MKRAAFLWTVLLALAITAISGATGASAATKGAGPVTDRIIVKFRDPPLDPARGDYLVALSGNLGVALVYVRPTSGGAHVLCVPDGTRSSDVGRIVQGM